MKKVLVMIVATMMATVSTNAQDKSLNEISIAYGSGANTDIIGTLYNGIFTGKQLDYWGPVSVEYFRRLENHDKLGFGAVIAIGGCKWEESGNAKTMFYTVMPAVKYNWLVKEHFSMYSKLAAGVTMSKDDDDSQDESKVGFNFQLTGVGMEFGGAFRGFIEAGLGEQGIFLAGLRYKF